MRVEFLNKFSKDIDKINSKSVKANLIKLIDQVESSETLESVTNLKKLVGHKSSYRARIANYRVGFFYDGTTIIFARIVHRKDIYKVFP
ncbi:MAG: type II toxin-antitoxin system RelE/ParE family toxin [Sphingobacteriaceae bacterium]|nr:type II toxin-antitoxin system RelE/ParE family toxin [Sphingobacteriaceae bacterium]